MYELYSESFKSRLICMLRLRKPFSIDLAQVKIIVDIRCRCPSGLGLAIETVNPKKRIHKALMQS